MLLAVLAVLSVALTCTMFATKNSMLGFPSGMFWAILSAYCYTLATSTTDLYYIIFIACGLGMTIFTIFAAYSLRKQDIVGPEPDKQFLASADAVDQDKDAPIETDDEGKVINTTVTARQGIRERAEKRRNRWIQR